jgi:hypothetical protein
MTTVVIEQPNYIPWIGYFDLIRLSDVWVWYDDVQYTKGDWRNRNCVALDGEPEWLTVPVLNKGRFTQTIREVEIDWDQPWPRKHLGTLKRCYARASSYGEVARLLESAFARRPRFLADLTIELCESICALLGLAPRFVRSSALQPAGGRQERLLDICRQLGATTYLSGPAARAYIDERLFADAGIALRYMVYDYPPYERGPHPFVPKLSVLDALAWLGPLGTAAFLSRHGQPRLN